MEMKKRMISIAMALALCLSLLPTAAFAQNHVCTEGEEIDHCCDECWERIPGLCGDADEDDYCDVCWNHLSCADEDKDHCCDECYGTVSECADENHDHWCDICGDVFYRTDPLDSGYYACEKGCGALEVNVTGEYTQLNYHGMQEGTLADGTVEVSVCIPNYEQYSAGTEYEAVKNGTVTVFWTDEEGSVFDTHTVENAALVNGKVTVPFTNLPIEVLHHGHLLYKPADPAMYLPASNGLILAYQENVHRLRVNANVDCTINGVYENTLYLFGGTDVMLIALGDFWGEMTWTYDEDSARPDYKVMGSIVTFTMPEDDVSAEMEYLCVTCFDEDSDHWCDFCDSFLGDCTDGNNDHFCDVCDAHLWELCADGEDENIHVCATCWASMPELCATEDGDHACDLCDTLIEGLCSDDDGDHFCDNEGCGTELSTCEACDWDEDHLCDLCGGGIYPSAGEMHFDTAIGDGFVTVTWDALPDIGSDKVASYIVTCCPENESTPVQQTVYQPGSDSYSHTFTNLKNDVVYDVSVEAWYTLIKEGYDAPFSASAAATVTGLPGAPEILSVTPGNGRITVEWKAPEYNGCPEILSYVVTAEKNGVGFGGEVKATGDTIRYTLDLLTNGNTYQIYVSAVNSVGQGPVVSTSVDIPLIPYDLLIGGVAVTEENMADVLGDGTVSFDPYRYILTLNNAHINVTKGNYGIRSKTHLTLKLVGENSVSCSGVYGIHSTDDMTVIGDGSLTVTANDVGIYIAGGSEVGGLYLKDQVKLTAVSGDVSSGNSYGVRVDDVLEVRDNAVLIASSGDAPERSCGIYAYDEVNLFDNAVVTAAGGDQSVDRNTDCDGIRTTHVTIHGGTLTATGGKAATTNGIYTQTFDMYGGTLTAASGSTAGGTRFGPSTALQATKSFFCSGGTITAASGPAGNDTSCGILVSNGHMVVDGGSLFAASGEANFSYGIKATKLSLADGSIAAESAPGVWCSSGISVDDRLAVSAGSILAKGTDAENYSYGLQAFDMRISGGDIEAAAGSAAGSYGLWAFGNMDLTCSQIALNPYAPGFIATRVNASSESGYGIYSRTGVAIEDTLTISAPGGGSVAAIGEDELTRYYTVAAADGTPAKRAEIELLTYKVSIRGLPTGYDMVVAVPAGWSLNRTYCEKYGVEDFSRLLPTEKDGYLFFNWYTDALCLAGTEYPGFDTPVTEDITLYPRWVRDSVSDPSSSPSAPSREDSADDSAAAFADVAEESYYYDAVNWALAKGITSGTSATTFSPDAPCTRAQMATFLWRAAGSPQPKGTSNPFADVPADAYYAKAVLWAAEQGITSGTSATTFSPDAPCTRAQTAAFIYRCEQAKGGGFTGAWMFRLPFTDTPEWAYESIAWCYKEGITSGTSATTFSPDAPCTRGQMVTFLHRFFAD